MVNESLQPAPEEPEGVAVPDQPAPSQPQPTIQEAPMQTMRKRRPQETRPAQPAPNVRSAFTSFETPALRLLNNRAT
nr:hypothetical protein [Terribacillus saccharophilus]